MKAYLDILQNVLDNGEWQDNRTGIRTLVVPNIHFSHDMKDGFPLLTTKKMAWKTMATELEGFIKGITSKKWYQDRGCNIWNEWANPDRVQDICDNMYHQEEMMYEGYLGEPEALKDYEPLPKLHILKKQIQKEEDDLGPIYGYQWRKFNAVYDEDDNGCMETYDQLDTIIKTLKTNPDDRRLVCSSWNPVQIRRMALPPCHLLWIITHINGILNLHWTQRSVDSALGLSFNIASYALLLELICKEVNMKPGNVSGMLCNCHIYENHINKTKQQLTREPKKLPTLKFNKWEGIYSWEALDIEFEDYNPHSAIKMEVAV